MPLDDVIAKIRCPLLHVLVHPPDVNCEFGYSNGGFRPRSHSRGPHHGNARPLVVPATSTKTTSGSILSNDSAIINGNGTADHQLPADNKSILIGNTTNINNANIDNSTTIVQDWEVIIGSGDKIRGGRDRNGIGRDEGSLWDLPPRIITPGVSGNPDPQHVYGPHFAWNEDYRTWLSGKEYAEELEHARAVERQQRAEANHRTAIIVGVIVPVLILLLLLFVGFAVMFAKKRHLRRKAATAVVPSGTDPEKPASKRALKPVFVVTPQPFSLRREEEFLMAKPPRFKATAEQDDHEKLVVISHAPLNTSTSSWSEYGIAIGTGSPPPSYFDTGTSGLTRFSGQNSEMHRYNWQQVSVHDMEGLDGIRSPPPIYEP